MDDYIFNLELKSSKCNLFLKKLPRSGLVQPALQADGAPFNGDEDCSHSGLQGGVKETLASRPELARRETDG